MEDVIKMSEKEHKKLLEDSTRVSIIKEYVKETDFVTEGTLRLMLGMKKESEGESNGV